MSEGKKEKNEENEKVSGRRGLLLGYVTNACMKYNIHVWNDWIASRGSWEFFDEERRKIKWKITSWKLKAFEWKRYIFLVLSFGECELLVG